MNAARAQKLMDQAGLDALILTSPRTIRYFTDYWSPGDELFREYMISPGSGSGRLQTFGLYAKNEEPALVIPPMFAANAAKLWVKDLYVYGPARLNQARKPVGEYEASESIRRLLEAAPFAPDAVDALVAALLNRGMAAAKLGIEMDQLAVGVLDQLRHKLAKASLLDATNLVRLVRAVKSAEEIQLLRRAAEINESSVRECLTLARPGASVQEIAHRFRMAAVRQGAEVDHAAFGYRGLGLATEPDWLLAREVLFVDIGCTYSGYFSDTGCTLAVESDAMFLEYETLSAAISAGWRAMRAGVRASEVHAAMQGEMDSSGLESFPHGHGLGIEIRDYPILVPDNRLRIRDDCIDVASDVRLEPNMVLNLEGSLWFPGVASLNIEQTFLVTAAGSEALTYQDRSLPFRT